jgi:uncharacterized protein YjbI with pentapeptide repeats
MNITNIWGKVIYTSQKETIKETVEEAVAYGTDLSEAYLWGVDLRGIDLWQVNLMWANLRKADFRGAVLREVNFGGADLRGAKMDEDVNLFELLGIIKN